MKRSRPAKPGWKVVLVAAVIGTPLVGCSGSASSSSVTTSSTVADSTTTLATATTVAPTTTTVAPTTTLPPLPTVKVTSIVGDQEVTDEMEIVSQSMTDPFGRFATCSGNWEYFGAYNVLISNPDIAVGSVQITTTANVHELKPADAKARIERNKKTDNASGKLSFGEDFSSGTFDGSTQSGTKVRIEFSCDSNLSAQPLDRDRPFIDVAVSLSNAGRQRTLSVGVQEPCTDGVIDIAAPADDPATFGALSAVAIAPDDLVVMIGKRSLNFQNEHVMANDQTSGTFRGRTGDGIDVAGAYSCRE